ncbi:ribosome recycling factor [Rothia sp. P7181]|uniref:ribosome recycling factor n=1 Tax=unclassified Rothia (in: high G+C Gram-positive bacteria) TaxID=2689056 RepID=UPI003ABF3C6E
MGFDLDGMKDKITEGVENVKDVVNEKIGKDVVNDDIVNQAKEKISEGIDAVTEKFGK